MIFGNALVARIKRLERTEAIALIMEAVGCDETQAAFYYLQLTEQPEGVNKEDDISSDQA